MREDPQDWIDAVASSRTGRIPWGPELNEEEFRSELERVDLAGLLQEDIPFDAWARRKNELATREILDKVWAFIQPRHQDQPEFRSELCQDEMISATKAVMRHLRYRYRCYREEFAKRNTPKPFQSKDLMIVPQFILEILPIFYSVSSPRQSSNDGKFVPRKASGFTILRPAPNLVLKKEIKKKRFCDIQSFEIHMTNGSIKPESVEKAFGPFGLKVLFGILRGLEGNAAKEPGYVAGYFEDSPETMLKRIGLKNKTENLNNVSEVIRVFQNSFVKLNYRRGKFTRPRRILYPRESRLSIDARFWYRPEWVLSRTRAVIPREITKGETLDIDVEGKASRSRNHWRSKTRRLARVASLTYLWVRRPCGVRIRIRDLADWIEERSEDPNQGMKAIKEVATNLLTLRNQGYIGIFRFCERKADGWHYLEGAREFNLGPAPTGDEYVFIEPPIWFEEATEQNRTFTRDDPDHKYPFVGGHTLSLLKENGLNIRKICGLNSVQFRSIMKGEKTLTQEQSKRLVEAIHERHRLGKLPDALYDRWARGGQKPP